MKKLLQITLISCSFSASVYANVGDLMYVRGDVNWIKFNNVSIDNKTAAYGQYKDNIDIKGGKYSHKYGMGGTVGLGYVIHDKFRGELVYNQLYSNKFKYSDPRSNTSSKIKSSINAFFARGIYDVLNLGATKGFVGVGVGLANVRHTITGTTKGIVTTTPAAAGPPPVAAVTASQVVGYNFKSKNKNNFAYSLMFGSTTRVMDDLHIEVAYSFTNYGKTSRVTGIGGGQIPLHAHSISVGLRYDLM